MKAVLQYRASAGFRKLLSELSPPWLSTVVVEEAERDRFAAEMRDTEVLLRAWEAWGPNACHTRRMPPVDREEPPEDRGDGGQCEGARRTAG